VGAHHISAAGAVAACLLALCGPAAAQSLSWAYEAGVVSDYRYRGVSLSHGGPTFQAGASIEHGSGLYGRVWGSTLPDEDGTGSLEVDFSAGRTFSLGGFDLDVGVVGYLYPQGSGDYAELAASAERTVGDWTFAAGGAFAPAQDGMGGRSDAYVYGSAEWAWPERPFSLKASLGQENGAWGQTKVDWSAGLTWRVRRLELSLAYVDTDDRSRAGVVAGLRIATGE
jgi:uncharacterized protein (TIGR02001 family)